MSKKRIGFVLSTTKPGGVEMSVLRTLERLDRDRFEPFFCVTSEPGSLHSRFAELARPMTAQPDYIVGVPEVDVLNVYNNLAWAAEFWDYPLRPRPDVIQHVYMHPQTLFWHHAKAKTYYRLLYNFFLHKYIVCDSPLTRDAIAQDATLLANLHPENYGGRKRDAIGISARIKVISHGVGNPESGRTRPIPRLCGRVLWVGNPTWVKGWDRLPAIIDANPATQFEIVCKDQPHEAVMGQNIHYHAALPPDVLADLRGRCNIYLATSRREGHSVAWEEARADGLVCIDAGGPPEPAESTAVDDLAQLWEDES